jgi:hypothetical protein
MNRIHDDVLTTAALMGENPDSEDDTIVERLVERGYNRLRAEVLVVFVPLGLARPLIARLNFAPPIHLPDWAIIKDYVQNRELKIWLADVPEFVAARELGELYFKTGLVSKKDYGVATAWGVEMKLINDALFAGKEPGGSTMSPMILMRLADAEGFDEWYRKVRPKNFIQRIAGKIKGSP